MNGVVASCVLFLVLISDNLFIDVSATLDIIEGNLKNVTNMSDDPDIGISAAAMIKRAGYPAESHYVTTEDGYILRMDRIPGPPGSTPVLVQHGILSSSADWVVTGKKRALGYLLADLKYDVWLGNARGNTYSRAHKTMSPKDSRFWEFSFSEVGMYDLPAMINYIVGMKHCKLIYIGHSMGTTEYYVMDIERKEVTKNVSLMISFAPEAYVTHWRGIFRYIATIGNDKQTLAKLLGQYEILPNSKALDAFARYICNGRLVGKSVCSNILYLIGGFDSEQLDKKQLPSILSHTPAGASLMEFSHYGQEIKSRRFCKYDFGEEKNKKLYNSTKPPSYDVSKITTPMIIYYALNDWVADERDSIRLNKTLTNDHTLVKIPYRKFTHLDYMYAKDAREILYNDVTRRMEKFRNPPNAGGNPECENKVK